MQLNVYLFIAIWILARRCAISKAIQKRQLYREQVSPLLGGKIPDTAFHTDRLALNQLQKVGIAIPDGVILQQRDPEVYQYTHKTKRPVYKVTATNDLRHTPNEGRYKTTASFETTYVIPEITQLKEHDLINNNIIRPTKKQLAIPHSFTKGHTRIKAINNVHPTIDPFQYWPYKDYNLDLNWQYQHPLFYEGFNQGYYFTPNIFNDFASFFDTYLHR